MILANKPKGVRARLDADRRSVTERYPAGESTCELGRDYGCSNASVWLSLKRWGVPIRQTKVVAPNRDRILELHAEGLSAYAIDKKLGLPKGAAERAIKQAGFDISFRQRGRGRAVRLRDRRDEIVGRYRSGDGCDRIAAEYGTGPCNVSRFLRKNGVRMRTVRDYAHPVDESFFDSIDTEAKAYVLGFMMADGCNHHPVPRLSLRITDRYVLEDIAAAMSYGGPLSEIPPREAGHKTQYVMQIGSRRLCDALLRAGCVPRKSYCATFPPEDVVPRHLVRHLIRGWLDGDGCITKHSKRNRWYVFVVGTEAACRGISAACLSHLGFAGHVRVVNSTETNTLWRFDLGARAQVKAFLSWIYEDATICLGRKYARYLRVLEDYSLSCRNPPDLV
jgi:hypothetical protein